MHRVHLVGCASALFDNLVATWQNRVVSCEQTELGAFPETIEHILRHPVECVVYCGYAAASSWDESATTGIDQPWQVEELARTAASVGANFLLISSDAVFTGPKLFHDESEPVAADGAGQQLHAAEQAALAFSDRMNVLVARTNAIGWSRNAASFAERLWESLERREPVTVDASSFATPIPAVDAAELVLRCCRARLSGVVHIVGAERTSPFRFAQELAEAAGFDRRLVVTKEIDSIGGDSTVRSREMSLASRLVRRELGVALPLLRETVRRFVDEATSGHRDLIRGATSGVLRAA
jgi:dTDP-4-dehydrorhamnose reductase